MSRLSGDAAPCPWSVGQTAPVLDSDVVWRRLAAGASLDGLGLSRVEGRWNLRSIGGPRPPWSGKDDLPEFRGATFAGLDLSGAELQHFRFFDCSFDDCVLDGADLVDWRQWSTSVRQCSFRTARIMGSMGGARRPPSSWQEVDFSRADLRDTAHHTESYTDCDFSHARLKGVSFDGSRHVRSTFAGPLEDVEFWSHPQGSRSSLLGHLRYREANRMDGVDLSAATVRFCTFNRLDLSACVFPSSPDHLRFDDRGAFAARVLDAIQGAEHVVLRVLMEHELQDAPPRVGGPGFRHRLDLGDSPEEIESAVALMRGCGAR